MEAPKDGFHNHPLAVMWLDSEGILHKVSKSITRTPESVKSLYSSIRSMTNGKKVCALIEVSRESISDDMIRQILKEEIPKTFSCVAILASTPLGTMIGTLFSVLAPAQVPSKVFNHESDARKWLKERKHLCS